MKNTKETQKETWQAPEITDLDVKKDTEGKALTFSNEVGSYAPS